MFFSHIPITNGEYKGMGALYFVGACAIGAIGSGFISEMPHVGTIVFLALSGLMGLISFATRPNRLVYILGIPFLFLGLGFNATLRKAFIENPLEDVWVYIFVLWFLAGAIMRPIASSPTEPDAEPETSHSTPPEDE